jgi:Reverse transcriptase (RNA-dependent DNA polymerase)
VSNTHPDPRSPAQRRPRSRRPGIAGELPIAMREVPRPGGGIRRIAQLPAADHRAYEAAVARSLPLVERSLGPEVFADRATLRGPRIELRDWRLARERLRRATGRLLRSPGARAILITDVRDCFASIEPRRIEIALRRLGADELDVLRIVDQLRSFADREVRGLPVGPAASAMLANALLCELDRSLRRRGLPFTRWVDDVVVFTPDRSTAARASAEVRRTLERIGLEANERKTRILTSRSEARELLGANPSTTGGPRRVP